MSEAIIRGADLAETEPCMSLRSRALQTYRRWWRTASAMLCKLTGRRFRALPLSPERVRRIRGFDRLAPSLRVERSNPARRRGSGLLRCDRERPVIRPLGLTSLHHPRLIALLVARGSASDAHTVSGRGVSPRPSSSRSTRRAVHRPIPYRFYPCHHAHSLDRR